MFTTRALLIATAPACIELVKAFLDQGIFSLLEQEGALALEEFDGIQTIRREDLKLTLQYLQGLGVLGLNAENEYYCTAATKSYLDCIAQLPEYHSIELNAASIHSILAAYTKIQANISDKFQQLSLANFLMPLLEIIAKHKLITESGTIDWSHQPDDLKAILTTLFLKLGWINQANDQQLSNDEKKIQAYLRQFKDPHTHGSILNLIPNINTHLNKFQQTLVRASELEQADCVVYLVNHSEIAALGSILPQIQKAGANTKQILITDDSKLNTDTTALFDHIFLIKAIRQGKTQALRAQFKKVVWINFNLNLSGQEDNRLIETLSVDLPATHVFLLNVQHTTPDLLAQACANLLIRQFATLEQDFAKKVLHYSRHALLPKNADALERIEEGSLTLFCAKLHVTPYKIDFLAAGDVTNISKKILTTKEVHGLLKAFPKWQFKIETAEKKPVAICGQLIKNAASLTTQDLHAALKLGKPNGTYLHLMEISQPTENEVMAQTLLQFIFTLAHHFPEIKQICFSQPAGRKLAPFLLHESVTTTAKRINDEIVYSFPIHAVAAKLSKETQSLAIAGYALRAPGAQSSAAFWDLIAKQQHAIAEYKITDRIKNPQLNLDAQPYQGGLLPQSIEQFDAEFFNISDNEAIYMDPQQRILLETVWHALEHAGLTLAKLNKLRAGVFIGASNQDFAKLIAKYGDTKQYDRYVNSGNNNGTLAGRIAHFLKIQGPCVVFDTACASSLTALHYAKKSLENSEIDIAIVGGVNLILSSEFTVGDEAMGVISKSGKVRSFSNDADGYVRSEGVAAVVVTRQTIIQAEQLRSHGQIAALQMNQETAGKHFTRPGTASQAQLMQQTLAQAGLKPQDIDFIEAHATGTLGGDAIELAAYENVFQNRSENHPLWLSSSKPNIGHTEAVSGLLSLIKVLLAFEKQQIPAQLHFTNYNERVEQHSAAIAVANQPVSFTPSENHTRRAAIASLSFAGTNVHAIIEEPQQAKTSQRDLLHRQWVSLSTAFKSFPYPAHTSKVQPQQLLLITSKTAAGLKAQRELYLNYLKNQPEENWLDIAYSSALGREHFPHRFAISANSIANAIAQLEHSIDSALPFSKQLDLSVFTTADIAKANQRYEQDYLYHGLVELYAQEAGMAVATLFAKDDREFFVKKLILQTAAIQAYSFVGFTLTSFVCADYSALSVAVVHGEINIKNALEILQGAMKKEGVALELLKGWQDRYKVELSEHRMNGGFEWTHFLTQLQQAYINQEPILWDRVWFGNNRQFIPLPTYAFQPQTYWPAILGGTPNVQKKVQTLLIVNHPDDAILLKIFSTITGKDITNIDSDFFDCGGNSIKLNDLKQAIFSEFGVDIPLKQLFDLTTVRKITAILPVNRKKPQATQLRADLENKHLPFPQTTIQQAYWVGREQPASKLGGVSTHLYYEVDWQVLDVTLFESTLQDMIARHDMLRAVMTKTGEQVILKQTKPYVIQLHDLSALTSAKLENGIADIRNRLSHEKFQADKWPLFRIEVIKTAEKFLLLFSFDCLIIDMFSLHLFMREWHQHYHQKAQPLLPIGLSFRDYVLATNQPSGADYEKAKQYWSERILTLPAAPDLPMKGYSDQLEKLTFARVTKTIPQAVWAQLKEKATQHKLSPTSVLLTLFSAVIAKWSTNKKFLLNLTLFTREAIHPDVKQLLGDFTLTELLSIDGSRYHQTPILEMVKQVHNQLWDDLEHKSFDGVSVVREMLKKGQSSDGQPIAPVVFTSLLNVDSDNSSQTWLAHDNISYGITQTPQLLLDHKTFEHNGSLVAEWDYVQDIFDKQLITDMHAVYCRVVAQIAQMNWQEKLPDLLPDWQVPLLHFEPTAVFEKAKRGLHHLFGDSWQNFADKTAVVSADRNLTYREVYATAQSVAKELQSIAKPNELIAVLCPPGWRQVSACIGIQYAGGAYLPLDVKWPVKYINDILLASNVKAILGCAEYNDLLEEVTQGLTAKKLHIDQVQATVTESIDQNYDPKHLAYVIFTSGSTGKPKGVMITHEAAVNTVLDINQRYHVTEHDTVFAISKLSFDLSVYDIYGFLAIGGKIVYPDVKQDNDPAHWYVLCQKNHVTIWNSVPRIVEMLTSYMSYERRFKPSLPKLRLVMMSGDSIPVKLPQQINQFCTHPQLLKMSLGGATEGSIWSIDYEIKTVQDGWTSIPYGKALTNQTMMVLDENMQETPMGVHGDIYIGGVGVAEGYWKDSTKTAAAFKINPADKKRIYCTGDRGYKNELGEIIFAGRLDSQAKINGFRVELDGIRKCMNQFSIIEDCAVLPIDAEGGKKLVAFVKRPLRPNIAEMKKAFVSPIKEDAAKAQFKLTAQGQFHLERLSSPAKVNLKRQVEMHLVNARKSYRQFVNTPVSAYAIEKLLQSQTAPLISTTSFSLDALLSVLAATQTNDNPLPKYLYASAGSTYPVKVYLEIGVNELGLQPGFYYYHSVEHALYSLPMKGETTTFRRGINVSFVGHHKLIQPLYGERSQDFIAYEQGSMHYILSQAAQTMGCHLQVAADHSEELKSVLSLNELDTVLGTFTVNTAKAPLQQEPTPAQYYIYNQRNDSDLKAGLYQVKDGQLLACDVVSPYPISLDHSGENASIVHDAAALLIVTITKNQADAYQALGSMAQKWMLNGVSEQLGLCPLGLPILPEAIYQHLQGQVQMVFAIGHVTPAQQADLKNSVAKGEAPSLGKYLQHALEVSQTLPMYMIPREYLKIETIPLTGNGKVDRKTLMEKYNQTKLTQDNTLAVTSEVKLPNDPRAKQIITMIEKVLNRKIDASKSFAANGVYSHNAHILRAAMEEAGLIFMIGDILKDSAIADFVKMVLARQENTVVTPLPQAIPAIDVSDAQHEAIAIIGMSCRFPGANHLDAYWQMLHDGVDGLSYYAASNEAAKLKSFGVIDGMLEFDHAFFNLPPRQAELMHPAQRVWLESVWHALEDAGYAGDRQAETIGVYASAGGEPYLHTTYYQRDGLLTRTQNEIDYFAARSAYQFNFTGPVLTVQSACSSSLSAIHLAVRSLRANEATMMVAGGIHTSRFTQKNNPADYQEGSIFSKQGQCQPFGATADGIVETQGVGVVVMKRLSKAQADGDHIYATIRGTAINNDGSHKRDFTSPNRDSQVAVIQAALNDAGVAADTITAVEAHGTGTPIGDPIEFESLNTIYRATKITKPFIALGSAKSNIGHTVTAAGVAGMIKMSLALHYQTLPATLHATAPNSALQLEKSSFYINHQTTPWQNVNAPLRGALSSFGMGGTNAHAILEQAQAASQEDEMLLQAQWRGQIDCSPPKTASNDNGRQLLVLSAKTGTALQTQQKQLLQFLARDAAISFADLAFTLAVGREHMSHRVVIEAENSQEAQLLLANASLTTPSSTAIEYATSVLSAQQLAAFNTWYQEDAFYRALVDSSKEAFVAVPDLGELVNVLNNVQRTIAQEHALSFVFLYNALRRYKSVGCVIEQLSGCGFSRLIVDIILKKQTLESALREVVADPKVVEIIYPAAANKLVLNLAEAKAGFRTAVKEHYRRGDKIDWQAYWRGSVRKKIRAPLYPFERQHFWHQAQARPSTTVREQHNAGLLGAGPIITAQNDIIFQQELDLDSPVMQYLTGHQVLSSCVFPGAGYSELIISAARRLDSKAGIELVSLTYKEPLKFNANEKRLCQVILKVGEDKQRYQVQIVTLNANSTLVHAEGEVAFKPSATQIMHVDLKRLAHPFTRQLNIATIYAHLAQDGVHYAASFRGMTHFSLNEAKTKGLVKLQLPVGLDAEGYTIHPVLLDSAFQALAGALLLDKTLPVNKTYLPVGHGALRFYKTVGSEAYAQISCTSKELGAVISGDIAIYTSEGDLALLITGLRLGQVPKVALQQRLGESTTSAAAYELGFEAAPLNTHIQTNTHTWLIVGGSDNKMLANLGRHFMKNHDHVTIISRQNIAHKTQLESLLKTLKGSVGIVYQAITQPSDSDTQVTQEQFNSVWSMVALAQGLSRHNISVTNFLVVTNQENHLDQGVYRGLTLSIAAAKPTWQVKQLDIASSDNIQATQYIINELSQESDGELLVVYRKSQRQVARLKRNTAYLQRSIAEKYFQQNETCVITGGLGGLGLRLAEWLVSKGAKHLVLLNRQSNTEPAIFNEWRKAEVTIEALAVDISQYDKLLAVFNQIRANRKQLVGIFHLAGVLRDKLLEHMTPEDFEAVFTAKVIGAHHLHRLSLNESALRYFVLFSSLVSLVGSAGQLNYAAANSFLDNLSDHRIAKGLPTQRFNFGAWAEVGMAAQLSDAQRNRGFGQISVTDGLKAIGVGLSSANTAVTIADVDWNKLWRGRQQHGLLSQLTSIKATSAPSKIATQLMQMNHDNKKAFIIQYLKERIAKELGGEASNIEESIGFQEMIHDSLQLTQLAEDIKTDFSGTVKISQESLWEYPNIQSLANFLSDSFAPSILPAKEDLNNKEIWRKSLAPELKCVYFGNIELFSKMFNAKRAIDSYCDAQGRTALYIAVSNNQTAMVTWLLERGADPKQTTTFNVSVNDIAHEVNSSEITEQLHNTQLNYKTNR